MDISIQYADPVSEDINSPPDWEQLSINYRQCTSAIGDSLVAELGSALTEVLLTEDVQVLLSTSNAPANGCEICCLEKDKACGQSKTTLKLISAMKGGREKQGLRLEKLTVTWAPDVYDPPATSLSHTVKSRNQQCSKTDNRNGKLKHKHKSRSSRSNSIGKKKQSRKSVGSYTR